MMLQRCITVLTRKKKVDNSDQTKLARVLSLFDLTALGVGSTLGLGVYILAGSVAKNHSGPAACISFLIAAVASAVAGLCYAEFASRVPRAGSAYVYSYVTVGEFAAFIIGWNLVLEYVIGTASLARGLSDYIDALANNTMSHALHEVMPINANFLSSYPDFLSLLFIALLTVLLSAGVKESTLLNNVFTTLNICTVLTVVIAGSIKADPSNWKIPEDEIPLQFKETAGVGGFMPFGVAGVIGGAAKCFYAFVGFDTVATTADEAKNPRRNIPLAIIMALFISFLVYFGISTVLTMAWPYYDQDTKAPFPYLFEQVGFIAVKWIVTIGAIFALSTSLIGAMFPLPRVVYAMASDGLIFRKFSSVNARTKTPMFATIISGILAGIMAVLFDVDQLVEMMSIGTLLAYTIVAVCVLILRYKDTDETATKPGLEYTKPEKNFGQFYKQLINVNNIKEPNSQTYMIACIGLAIFSVLSFGISTFAIFGSHYISIDEPYALSGFIILCFITFLVFCVIARQPKANIDLTFKVPLVPILPCLSILVNVTLMITLEGETWIRFIAWIAIGLLIYFFYGVRNADAAKEEQVVLTTNGDANPQSDKIKETTKF
ncbi:C-terminus of AA-permease, partial [Popillia japonica]